MTKSDDPFAKTELGKPLSAMLGDQPALETGRTEFAPVVPEPPIAGRSKPSRTVLAAPDFEALASSEAFEKGFTNVGGATPGPGRTQPAQWKPGNTEAGAMGPGYTELGAGSHGRQAAALPAPLGPALPDHAASTMAGGAPPAEALAAARDAAAVVERELQRADALHAQGVQAGKAGQFAHSDALLRESLDLRRRYRPPGDPLVAHGCVSLGTLYFYGQRPDLAEPLYREAWALHRQGLGDMHPDTATRAVELARVLVPLGRVPEAAGMLRGAYEVYSRTIGPFHHATLEVAAMLRQLGG